MILNLTALLKTVYQTSLLLSLTADSKAILLTADSKAILPTAQQCQTKPMYNIEKQYYDAYTHTKFKEFQTELEGKMHCGISSFEKNTISHITVDEDINIGTELRRVPFMVHFNEDGCEVNCVCRLFEFRGILCRHAIVVLIHKNVTSVPEKYILHRWKAGVKRGHSKVKISYGNWTAKPELQRNDKMCNLFYEVTDLANGKEEDFNKVMRILNDLKVKLTQSKVNCEKKEGTIKLAEKTYDKKLSENGCEILDPVSLRSKGRPPVNRKQSMTEKIIQRRKEAETTKSSNENRKLSQVRLQLYIIFISYIFHNVHELLTLSSLSQGP